MTRLLLAAALAVAAAPLLAADVGVSISIGEPDFYGRIDIGDFPAPELVYPQPVIIHREPSHAPSAAIYLRVPPGHEKHWDKHCREYDACGRPVYFVRDKYYREVYAPRYREREQHAHERNHGDRHDDRNDDRHGKGSDKDRRDQGRDRDRD